ncbi:MAG: universal stress protein [Paracoccaceae bacterium]
MYKNILVPIAPDHPPNSSGAIDVARLLLDEGGTITALTVAEAIPSYAAQQIPAELINNNLEDLDVSLKADLGGVKGIETAVVVGHAATAIMGQAEARGCDLIVIASHRPGLVDYFLGSTAGRVVRHAKCAVHVVR